MFLKGGVEMGVFSNMLEAMDQMIDFEESIACARLYGR